jgi:Domain of unknown function (DUF397)
MDHPDDLTWRKSSYGGNCIEVAATGRAVAVRDSTNPGGPKLAVTAAAWTAFTSQLKADG